MERRGWRRCKRRSEVGAGRVTTAALTWSSRKLPVPWVHSVYSRPSSSHRSVRSGSPVHVPHGDEWNEWTGGIKWIWKIDSLDTTPGRRHASVPEETNGKEMRFISQVASCSRSSFLGIAQFPFVSSFVGLVTRPSCLTLLTPYERSRRWTGVTGVRCEGETNEGHQRRHGNGEH